MEGKDVGKVNNDGHLSASDGPVSSGRKEGWVRESEPCSSVGPKEVHPPHAVWTGPGSVSSIGNGSQEPRVSPAVSVIR